jgi:hypothetical protein
MEPAIAQGPAWIAVVNENRDYLRDLGRQAERYGDYSREVAKLLEQPVPGELGVEERRLLFSKIGHVTPTRGWVCDATVAAVLAAALTDEDRELRQEAFDRLTWRTKKRVLALQAAEIKAALKAQSFRGEATLLALLPLSDEEKAELLRRPDLPLPVRARLGDAQAEQELIDAVAHPKGIREMQLAAVGLGYVGTRRAGETLVRALKSDVATKPDPDSQESIRPTLIMCLGRIHEDDPIVTTDYDRVVDEMGSGGRAQNDITARTYLDRLYEWARVTYGVTPEGPEGLPLLWRYGSSHPFPKRGAQQ